MRLASGQLYISEINLNQELGAHLGFGKPTIRVATPIKNMDNQTLAIIVINVNLDELFNHICSDLPSEFKLLLTNSAGDYLIHSDPRKAFGFEKGQKFLIQNDIPASKSFLTGEQEYKVVTTVRNNGTGGPSLAALMRVPFGLASASRTILLVLYIPLETVLAESKSLGYKIIQVTFVFGLFAIIISLILARILTQPLNLMSKTISQFELGKPLAKLPSQRKDEIGYLAKSFSAMADKLNQQVAELYASEAQLQKILDNLPLGIWLVGTDGQLHFLNKTFREALGITHLEHPNDEELLKLLRFNDSDDQPDFPKTRHESLTFTDGQQHLLEITQIKLTNQYSAANAMVGIATDITERKQAEEVLRSSEEKLRSMFEMSPLGIARNSMDGRYIEVNKAFLEMVGYSLDELNRMSYWQLTPKEYEQLEAEQLQRLAKTGKYGPYEKEYYHRDGNRIPIRLNGVLITDSDDRQYIWSIVEDITQSKHSERLIWHQANFDPLTGLPNRRMFHEHLEHDLKKAHRTKLPLALIFLDLDRFKEVNDTLGHDIGDLLLQDAARLITSCVRESDIVARLGGDEFTLILGDLDDESRVERIAQNILRKLAEPFQLKNKLAYVSGSIGITFYPNDAQDIDVLIRNADQAMYSAKHQGRNRYSFFTASMQTGSHDQNANHQ